jgi:hypothetical protein
MESELSLSGWSDSMFVDTDRLCEDDDVTMTDSDADYMSEDETETETLPLPPTRVWQHP